MNQHAIIMLTVTVLMTGTMAVLMLAMLKKWRNSQAEAITENDLLSLPKHRCPKCGVSMQPGLAIASRGVLWRKAGEAKTNLLYGKFTPVKNTMNMALLPRYNRAWNCEQCGYLLVDASAMVMLKKSDS